MNPTTNNYINSKLKLQSQIIKVDTDLNVSLVSFPTGSLWEINDALTRMIGPECTTYQNVNPKNLYSVFGMNGNLETKNDVAVSMLVDDDGLYHDLPINILGSYLYQTYLHGNPVVGTCLFVGSYLADDGEATFCGLPDSEFWDLFMKISAFCLGAKEEHHK